jgi:hypothetical protein
MPMAKARILRRSVYMTLLLLKIFQIIITANKITISYDISY